MRLSALVLAAAAAAPAPAAGETTKLSDESGVLQIEAPGTWRTQDDKRYAIYAVGFIAGVKRGELFAVLHADLKDAAAAGKRWKDARAVEAPKAPVVQPAGDGLHFISADADKKSVDYGRALAGAGITAVVWVRLNGEAGVHDADAFALLDAATLVKAGGGDAPGAGAGRAPSAAGAGGKALKDRDFALEVTLPADFVERKDVTPPQERLVLSAKGPIGADKEAFVDVHHLPDFDRSDAAGWWWIETERRGWGPPQLGVKVVGEPPKFTVLPNGETYSRHVRIVDTKAGLYGIKVDVESSADQAAQVLLDTLVEGAALNVLKPRPERPLTLSGQTALENAAYFVLSDASAADAEAIAKEALAVDALVKRVLGLDAIDGRRGTLRIAKDQAALDAALRPLGAPAGVSTFWSVRTRELHTRVGAFGDDKARALFVFEAAREAIRRRFGFRPPFWLEHGVAHVVEASVANRGRIDLENPALTEQAREAASTNLEFEVMRWWTHAESGGNAEREAVVWAVIFLMVEDSPVAKKWQGPFQEYVTKLRTTGNPAEATKVFPFDRDAELIDDYRKRVKKFER